MGQSVQLFKERLVFQCAIDYIESRDDSLTGRVQYHLVGRLWLLAEALCATITALGSLCIAGVAFLYSLINRSSEGKTFAQREIQNANSDWGVIQKCFSALVSQQLLPENQEEPSKQILPGKAQSAPPSPSSKPKQEAKEEKEGDLSPFVDLGGDRREDRVVVGEDVICRKLETELGWAKTQMSLEESNPSYSFIQAEEGFGGEGCLLAMDPIQGHQCIAVGAYQFIGERTAMEDRCLIDSFRLDLAEKAYPVQVFGVFDGHNGMGVSQYVKEIMIEKLSKTLKEFNQSGLTTEGTWNALKQTFVRLNADLKEKPELRGQGTTAIVAMYLDGVLWVANVGDSRAVIVGQKEFVASLSEDAKPDKERYQKSIEKRGGCVIQATAWSLARVNDTYAVARALEGDGFWIQGISARPKITRFRPSPEEVLILGSDGLFDVASSEQIGRAVLEAGSSQDLYQIARNLVFSSAKAGSKDNITALIAKFDQWMSE